MTNLEPPPTNGAVIRVLPSSLPMTGSVRRALAMREMQLNGRSVLVTVGQPQRIPSNDTGRRYLCRSRIEGLRPSPVGLEAIGSAPAQALVAGLIEVCTRLSVTLVDFLSEARIGGVLIPDFG